jgi:hypothetical protein
MIGTIEEAEYALAGESHFLARGTARDVYIADGIVYKVEIESGSNDYEIDNLIRLSNMTLPPMLAVPEWNVYNVDGRSVIAMPFIEGREVGECYCDFTGTECDCPPDSKAPISVIAACQSVGITDLSVGNLIYRDGIYYIVDAEM